MSRIAKLRPAEGTPMTSSGRPTSPQGRTDKTKTPQRPSKLDTKQETAYSKLTRLTKASSEQQSGKGAAKTSSSKKTSPVRSPSTKTKSGSKIPGFSSKTTTTTTTSLKGKTKSVWRKSDSAESNLDTSPEYDYVYGLGDRRSKLVVSGYETANSDLFSSEAEMQGMDSDVGGTEGGKLYCGSPSADSGCETMGRSHGVTDRGRDDQHKIYTDWANHYLEKARYKRYITDLQVDVCDGVLLADVITAVTNEKVANINTRPRSSSQMVENISSCLAFLAELGVNVDGLCAKDIKDGNLKSILGLFFSLSRFKQQQKSLNEQTTATKTTTTSSATTCNSNSGRSISQPRVIANGVSRSGSNNNHLNASPNTEMLSRLPSPFKASSKCPTIAHPNNHIGRDHSTTSTSLDRGQAQAHRGQGQGQGLGERRRSAGGANNNNSLQISGGSTGVRSSSREPSVSRSTSPSVSSGIPLPGSRSTSAGRAPPSGKLVKATSTSSCASSASGSSKSIPTRGSASSSTAAAASASAAAAANKNSMLDKFKFFKDKKAGKASSKTKNADRTSASGGGAVGAPGSRLAPPTPTEEVGAGAISNTAPAAKGAPKKTFGRKKDGAVGTPVAPPVVPGGKDDSSNNNKRTGTTSSTSSIPSRAASTTSVSSTASSSTGTRGRQPKAEPPPRSEGSPSATRKGSKLNSLSTRSASTGKLSKSTAGLSTAPPSSGLPAPAIGTGIPKPGSRASKLASKEDGNKNRLSASSKTSLSSTSESQTRLAASAPSKTAMLQGRSVPNVAPTSVNASQEAKVTKLAKASGGTSQGLVSPGERPQSARAASSSAPPRGARVVATPRAITPGGSGSRELSHSTSGHALAKSQVKANQAAAAKPKKVDSDTQTQMSAINPGVVRPAKIIQGRTHMAPPGQGGQRVPSPSMQAVIKAKTLEQQRAAAVSKASRARDSSASSKEQSNTSLNSDSNSASNSTSNSNNSASSTDSVIFRPSSCDELESGLDSDTNSAPRSPRVTSQQRAAARETPQSPAPKPYTDHITQLRQSRGSQSPSAKNNRKMETTFDTEVRTEEREVSHSPRETTIGDDAENFDEDIKPMQPIMRATQYGFMLGPSPLPRPSFHIPTLSNQNHHLAHSAQSRLGVNRPLIDPNKLYTNSMNMKRTASNCNSVLESDYSSDAEGFDIAAGYMSDGDILRVNQADDIGSGYMSEGGASLYARRMQQRFREGMMAVKECMQKSSGLVDDDSFDDSSSISSGEISDTINEISTDENLTGSSLSGTSSDHTNPYGSLKRAPMHKDVPTSLASRSLPTRGSSLLKKPPGSLLGKNLNYHGKDSVDGSAFNWRKYAIGGGEQPVDLREGWTAKERDDLKVLGFPTAAVVKKKTSKATITDLRQRIGRGTPTGFAYEDPKLRTLAEPVHGHQNQKQKKDSETNTDHSVMMGQSGQNTRGFGLRRPGSAASISSNSSSKNSKGARTPEGDIKGERLSNYKGSGYICSPSKGGTPTDGGPQGYSASTLERRRKAALMAAKAQQGSQSSPEDHYHSLGRRKDGTIREKLFGSRSSLNKGDVPSTIISNPHATYTKDRQRNSAGESSPTSAYGNNYLSPDYSHSRPLSGVSSPTSSWLKNNGMRGTMSETESMESISSTASSIQAQIQQAKALSLASRSILQRDGQLPSTGLHRSDSFKSTKSEQFFNSMSQSEELPRTNSWNQLSPSDGASSPTPSHGSHSSSSRFTYPLSAVTPTSGIGLSLGRSSHSPYSTMIVPLAKMSGSKEDDLHASQLSLVSTSSSVYSTAEEKQQQEIWAQSLCPEHRPRHSMQLPVSTVTPIRKLKRELDSAQEKVSTLNTQLSTNAHVVSAFEQSLSNMTHRLQHLTSTAEAKDVELNELRATIEALKTTGITGDGQSFTPGVCRRRLSSTGGGCNSLPRDMRDMPGTPEPGRMVRQMSAESMSSLNSMSSACSGISQMSSATDTDGKKKKKKSWVGLRSSFSKAFSRKKNKQGSMSDVEPDTASLHSQLSVPNSPLLTVPHYPINSAPASPLKGSHSSGTDVSTHSICDPKDDPVLNLQQQLHEKDMKLTDIRLEALSSAHQLEQLRDAMNRMKTEMMSLKADNSRLQVMVSKTSSPTSPPPDSLEKRLSLDDPSNLDLLLNDSPGHSGQRVTISVYLSPTTDISRLSDAKPTELLIGAINVSGRTKWEMLDSAVRRMFKEYVLRIDPITNLGLNTDSVYCYRVTDEITRTKGKDATIPELLPCGYLVGENTNITITLKGIEQNTVDALAFETLMPKSIVQRYISLLLEHRRIILCGPSGTGKTYLAQKLAEYLVLKSNKQLVPGVIATFNVDHKSSKELRQYLANIADQCESTTAGELPSVIILDNLHHVGSLGEVFNGFLNVKYQTSPYIIGTMNQATCSTTNLQLHHNFRWVLCANHMEPVKGFLGRFLRRKLVEEEVRQATRNADLNKVMDWVPRVWQHLNKFLETHSSSDVTIGPRLFLSCPMEVPGAQVWFTDLWNYSIVPYILEAVREGIQLYGRRAPWEDPVDWVVESYPWASQVGETEWPSLLKLRPEDVGYDPQGAPTAPGTKAGGPSPQQQSDVDGGDPLMNMLMRLQEAASYSSPQSNDSDSTSLDSHGSGLHDSNANSSVESTL